MGKTEGDVIRNMSDGRLAQLLINIAYENAAPLENGDTPLKIPSPLGGYLTEGTIEFNDYDIITEALRKEVPDGYDTLSKAIDRYKNNADRERTQGNREKYLEFIQLVDWLTLLKQIIESGDCNTCACKPDCPKVPMFGQQVRYNCFAYVSKSEVKNSDD